MGRNFNRVLSTASAAAIALPGGVTQAAVPESGPVPPPGVYGDCSDLATDTGDNRVAGADADWHTNGGQLAFNLASRGDSSFRADDGTVCRGEVGLRSRLAFRVRGITQLINGAVVRIRFEGEDPDANPRIGVPQVGVDRSVSMARICRIAQEVQSSRRPAVGLVQETRRSYTAPGYPVARSTDVDTLGRVIPCGPSGVRQPAPGQPLPGGKPPFDFLADARPAR